MMACFNFHDHVRSYIAAGLLVCKIEGIFNDFYAGLIAIGGDGDNIKPGLGIGLFGVFKVIEGHHGNLTLLFGGNRQFRAAVPN